MHDRGCPSHDAQTLKPSVGLMASSPPGEPAVGDPAAHHNWGSHRLLLHRNRELFPPLAPGHGHAAPQLLHQRGHRAALPQRVQEEVQGLFFTGGGSVQGGGARVSLSCMPGTSLQGGLALPAPA